MPNNDTGAYYSLDIAFASAAKPHDATQPIALAYAYSNDANPNRVYQGRGQTKEVLDAGDWVMFAIFDMSSGQNVALSSVQISVKNTLGNLSPIVTPFSSSPPNSTPDGKTPMAWPSQTATSWTAQTIPTPYAEDSAGCNVKGQVWVFGPFYANNPGQFEMTVTFTATGGAGGSPLNYSIDPEMEVQSGGN